MQPMAFEKAGEVMDSRKLKILAAVVDEYIVTVSLWAVRLS